MESTHPILLTRNIKPDYGFYIQGDDRLLCVAYSSVASLVVRFSGYSLSSNGEVRQYAIDVAPTSDRAATSSSQIFGEGFILSCTATLASGSAKRGQCYIRAHIQRGTGATVVPVARLLGGYLSTDSSPTFPYGTIEGPLEGRGMLRSITGSNPAAGAEITETVPTGARWRLWGFRFTLVTDANVANRRVKVGIDDGTTLFIQGQSDENHTAGVTNAYSLGAWGTATTSVNSVEEYMFPLPLDLLAGWRILTSTVAVQVGDDYAAPQLYVEEWIEA